MGAGGQRGNMNKVVVFYFYFYFSTLNLIVGVFSPS